MTKAQQAVQLLLPELQGKRVLEAACGQAEFSLAAAPYAKEMVCIDLESKRLDFQVLNHPGIRFAIMDAAHTCFAPDSFDTIVFYNAFCHVEDQWQAILAECRRMLSPAGNLFLLGSWKMEQEALSRLFAGQGTCQKGFHLVRLGK